MPKIIAYALLASVALAPAAMAQNMKSADQQWSAGDKTFVQKAGLANMFEIESSELADSRAQSDQVKEFADKMIDDHGRAGTELKSIAGNAVPSALDSAHEQKITTLSGLKGAEFDRAYVAEQQKAHKEAVDLFSKYSKSADNAELKKFAADTLPVLKEHQEQVNGLSASEGRASTPAQKTAP